MLHTKPFQQTCLVQGVGPRLTAWCVSLGMLCVTASVSAVWGQSTLNWKPFGAAPNTAGQVENLGDGEVTGAINAVAPHPNDANTLYVGAVNGGIWLTRNAMNAVPTWTNLTDDQPSLAVGALEFDPMDATFKTLLVGTGQFSSFGAGGPRTGLLRTTDAGTTWKVLNGGGLATNLNITGVAPRGSTLVASASSAANSSDRGIWRSTDQGATWKQISGAAGSGLPSGASFDLAGDPADLKRLFTNAGGGLYRSTDTGATWSKVSNSEMDTKLNGAQNLEVAVGKSNNVFVAIVGSTGELAGVFHSANGGANWTNMGVPTVGGTGIHPGRQGRIHLSIAADPINANLVYVGGDRQDGALFPTVANAIGARDFSGCLFRGDASATPAKRWFHLTHSKSQGAAGGGTASGSAPHADSRDMDVAKDGTLIEGDDGGVYKRTDPQTNAGDWFSINGNLQTAEYHAVAWDANANIVVAGAQDTGSSEQLKTQQPRFRSISTADGGVVAVDDTSTPGFSVRYSSNQFLGRFRRRLFDAGNNLQGSTFVSLAVVGGGNVSPQFYTPIALNAFDPERLVIGGADAVYESLNQGDTCRRLSPGITANGSGLDTIAYGAEDNPNVLYVGAGSDVFVRVLAPPAPLVASSNYQGGPVRGIAGDVTSGKVAFVISPVSVHQTTDAGATWTDLTENLASLQPGTLHSVAYIPAPGGAPGSLLLGADHGVYVRRVAVGGAWTLLATGLPRVPVYHLEYDDADNILLAGTLGRGAWQLDSPSPSAAVTMVADAAAMPPGDSPAAMDEGSTNDAPESKSNAVELRDGVLVDRDDKHVYLMRPQGGVQAIELTSGEVLWEAKDADKPLEVAGDLVICQAADPAETSRFEIVTLDRKTGDTRVRGEHELPPEVNASVVDTFDGSFSAGASLSGNQLYMSWQFVERPTGGLPPGFEKGVAPEAEETTTDAPQIMAPERIGARSGVVQMSLTSGETTSLNVEPPIAMAANAADSMWEPEGAERLKQVEGEQFRSLDGRHVVGSVRTGKPGDRYRYTLAVYERESGNRLGQFQTQLAIVPLVVVDNFVVYESAPNTQLVNGKLVDEPLTVQVANLEKGERVWARPIRDTSYRGPMPP